MKQLLVILPLATFFGCANVDQGKVLDVAVKAAACAASVNTTATNPECRAPVAVCEAAYKAGRDAVTSK